MDKVQKIRAEVERLHKEYRRKEGAWHYRKALRTVLFLIDTMQEDPVSGDLEEAAIMAAMLKNDIPKEHLHEYPYNEYGRRKFIEGVQWKEQQMMKKAIDGVVTFDYYGDDDKTYGCIAHDSFCLEDFGLKDMDKVKMILIKED